MKKVTIYTLSLVIVLLSIIGLKAQQPADGVNSYRLAAVNKRFLPVNKNISLKIYNSLGQEVRTIIDNASYPEGQHTVQWDSRDSGGNLVASGVYIYKLIFGNFSKSKTMTLVR